jgi:hypothetical protein
LTFFAAFFSFGVMAGVFFASLLLFRSLLTILTPVTGWLGARKMKRAALVLT